MNKLKNLIVIPLLVWLPGLALSQIPVPPCPPPNSVVAVTADPPPSPLPGSMTGYPQGIAGAAVNSTAVFPLPNTPVGSTLTVYTRMPPAVSYGPPPPFADLSHGNTVITSSEARAYPPLDSDFLYASSEGKVITKAQYEHWVATQF